MKLAPLMRAIGLGLCSLCVRSALNRWKRFRQWRHQERQRHLEFLREDEIAS